MGKKIVKIVIVMLVVVIMQTVTFLMIGPFQLRKKLLSGDFVGNKFHSDSLFVRDYYVDECGNTSYYSRYITLNLKKDSGIVLKKFDVRFAHFSEKKLAYWLEEKDEKYNLVYNVYAYSPAWSSLFGLYECKVGEFIHFKKGGSYQSESRISYYRWLLFFWIKTNEYGEHWNTASESSHISHLISHI